MIKIDQVDVRFEVEGEGDEAAFARLFERNIRRWKLAEQEAASLRKLGERERLLGDRESHEEM